MHPARAYVLIKLLVGLGFGFTSTIYVPFLMSRGLSYSDVALINVFFWAIIVVAEIPTGMLADGRSRAWAVRTGLALFAIGTLSYSFASGVVSATISEILEGLANAFVSGADEAWITDALRKREEETKLRQVITSASMAATGGMLVGGIIAAPLGCLDLRIGWWLASFCFVVSLIIARCFMSDHGEPPQRVSEREALRQSFHLLSSSSSLRWLLGAQMLFAFVLPFNHYWAPFMQGRVGQAGLSYVWCAIFGSVVAGNWFVRRFDICTSREENGIVVAMVIIAGGLLAAPYASGIACPILFLALHEFGRGLNAPLCVFYMQKRVESSCRATYGSLQSLLSKISCAVVLSMIWLYTREKESSENLIRTVWTACSTMLLLGTAVLRWRRPAHTDSATALKPSKAPS